jgi:hypothetical protein
MDFFFGGLEQQKSKIGLYFFYPDLCVGCGGPIEKLATHAGWMASSAGVGVEGGEALVRERLIESERALFFSLFTLSLHLAPALPCDTAWAAPPLSTLLSCV